MYQAIIFDLDGLLIDSEIISYQLYQDLLCKYNQSFTVEKYSQNYSGKSAVTNMENLIKNYQLPITVQEGLDFMARHKQEYFNQGVKLKDGALELLQYLKNNHYQIVLATSSIPKRALGVLKQNQIDTYFDQMVFGTEIKQGKPYPDIFLKACKKVAVKPEDALVLEDSEAGIEAASRANIPVICIPDMKMPESRFQAMTTKILDSLTQVIDYLEAIE